MEHTEAQEIAISTRDSNLLIVARAGSGKTEVISERIAGLLDKASIMPGNIVTFTFTDRATAELKERVHPRIKARRGEVHGQADVHRHARPAERIRCHGISRCSEDR